jgi:hypothetical protein
MSRLQTRVARAEARLGMAAAMVTDRPLCPTLLPKGKTAVTLLLNNIVVKIGEKPSVPRSGPGPSLEAGRIDHAELVGAE